MVFQPSFLSHDNENFFPLHRRNITKELSNMQETVSILQAQIQTKRYEL